MANGQFTMKIKLTIDNCNLTIYLAPVNNCFKKKPRNSGVFLFYLIPYPSPKGEGSFLILSGHIQFAHVFFK